MRSKTISEGTTKTMMRVRMIKMTNKMNRPWKKAPKWRLSKKTQHRVSVSKCLEMCHSTKMFVSKLWKSQTNSLTDFTSNLWYRNSNGVSVAHKSKTITYVRKMQSWKPSKKNLNNSEDTLAKKIKRLKKLLRLFTMLPRSGVLPMFLEVSLLTWEYFSHWMVCSSSTREMSSWLNC